MPRCRGQGHFISGKLEGKAAGLPSDLRVQHRPWPHAAAASGAPAASPLPFGLPCGMKFTRSATTSSFDRLCPISDSQARNCSRPFHHDLAALGKMRGYGFRGGAENGDIDETDLVSLVVALAVLAIAGQSEIGHGSATRGVSQFRLPGKIAAEQSGRDSMSPCYPPLRTVLAIFTAHGSSEPVTPSPFCFYELADDSTGVPARGLRLRPLRPVTLG